MGHQMKLRVLAAAMTTALGIAACGGNSGHTSTTAPKPNSAAVATGTATGDALVHEIRKIKFTSPEILASDFRGWVSGKLAQNSVGAPEAPLSTPERAAAAAVFIKFASRLIAEEKLPPDLKDGESSIKYLQTHGVH
jgi:hypothetical protein